MDVNDFIVAVSRVSLSCICRICLRPTLCAANLRYVHGGPPPLDFASLFHVY